MKPNRLAFVMYIQFIAVLFLVFPGSIALSVIFLDGLPEIFVPFGVFVVSAVISLVGYYWGEGNMWWPLSDKQEGVK